jgi:anthranilate phosphoribosyltransferase
VSLWGSTAAFVVERGEVRRLDWDGAALSMRAGVTAGDLRVGSPAESAAVIRSVLAGEESPARHVVIANGAAALFAAGRAGTIGEGLELARETIDSGAAGRTLARLVEVTGRAGADPRQD